MAWIQQGKIILDRQGRRNLLPSWGTSAGINLGGPLAGSCCQHECDSCAEVTTPSTFELSLCDIQIYQGCLNCPGRHEKDEDWSYKIDAPAATFNGTFELTKESPCSWANREDFPAGYRTRWWKSLNCSGETYQDLNSTDHKEFFGMYLWVYMGILSLRVDCGTELLFGGDWAPEHDYPLLCRQQRTFTNGYYLTDGRQGQQPCELGTCHPPSLICGGTAIVTPLD